MLLYNQVKGREFPKKENKQVKENKEMRYCVYTNAAARTLTAEFDTFEEAKKFVDKKKTKYGHSVVESDGRNAKTVYRTYGNK